MARDRGPLRAADEDEDAEEMATGTDNAGKNDREGAAIADHLKALKAGIMEVMKWAFSEEDLAYWMPNKGARPRLRELGITMCIATIQMEVIMAEREKITEDMDLRLS